VRFESEELLDFESLGADDHVKLFLPDGAGRRDYTPRAFDASLGTLTIDFAAHEAGPATSWALAAVVGDTVEIGGPRGSLVVPDDFDWYLLIGDETALPAIGRRVEALRAGVPVRTVAVVADAGERQDFVTRADWEAVWVTRDGRRGDDAGLLQEAIGELPAGDGYVWIAAEAGVARALRAHVVEGLGHPKGWVKAAGYWVAGQADAHVSVED
jgi:NADPH-dependent ferric siderophore reductase